MPQPPAEAELGADVLIFGAHRLIGALSPGLLHILCGTISAALTQRLIAKHAARSIDLVIASVSGTPTDAANGQLQVVVHGTDQAITRALPLLEIFSRDISLQSTSPEAFLP